MKQIPLTKGHSALVDDQDYEWLSQWKWHEANGYARRVKKVKGRCVPVYMHRQILEAEPKQVIDHLNHNPLDNRRENLCVGTQRDNLMNRARTIRPEFSSPYRGVAIHRPGRFIVQYRKSYVGLFSDEVEAALAYDRAAIADQGPAAQVNFPGGVSCQAS